MNQQIDIGDGRTLSMSTFSRPSGMAADLHIWFGDDQSALTGSGVLPTIRRIEKILHAENVRTIFVSACDDRRQRVFERVLERAGAQRVIESDIDGDASVAWRI